MRAAGGARRRTMKFRQRVRDFHGMARTGLIARLTFSACGPRLDKVALSHCVVRLSAAR